MVFNVLVLYKHKGLLMDTTAHKLHTQQHQFLTLTLVLSRLKSSPIELYHVIFFQVYLAQLKFNSFQSTVVSS